MNGKKKITPSDLRRKSETLILARSGAIERMPSLEELLTVIAGVRQKYVPLIMAAREKRDHKF